CTVGLPGVLVVLADNQVPGSAAAERAGAAVVADARATDFDAALDRAFTGLMRSAERRGRLSRAATALCDGRGAERAADALLAAVAAKA
ncbi:MAG TPA: UDP-2,4-diacetamido-2,4,6-trideoxy-beta-L-altropyranose hydrolase, partial [Caulobacteraceae bacterium]|nr:UDP-2,4-diacetamido-2,4,6-trideoxy-beta-L-altropyranose hydrolase [Caulobacteraceae bacterium]